MRQILRRLIRSSPACFAVLRCVLERYRRLGIGPDTQLVVEGYPRCANSFTTLAVMQAQTQPVKIAHHLHCVAQVKLAVRRGLPALVLIRDPRDAALSLTIRKELPAVDWALQEYLDFYRPVAALAEGVVVADFTETTTDMGAVIRRVNQRFGTHLQEFDHTDENVAAVYAELEQIEQDQAGGEEVRETHVARPSAARRAIKDDLAAQLEVQPAQGLLAEAESLYRTILAQHAIALPDRQEPAAH